MNFLKKNLYQLYKVLSTPFSGFKRYKGGQQKSALTVILEQLRWFITEGNANEYYYLFGLNIQGSRQKDFVGRKEILKYREKAERILYRINGTASLQYDVLTKDKFIAGNYFSALGLPLIPVLGLVSGNYSLTKQGERKELSEIIKNGTPFVLKNISMEAADGFLMCEPVSEDSVLVNGIQESISELLKKLSGARYILQEKIQSHSEYRKFNGTALNTTRIVTILTSEGPVYLGGFQSFATGTSKVDAWSQGAVYVGFDSERSSLKGNGYFHPGIPGAAICDVHPDSGLKFENHLLPYLKDAVELCLKAHEYLYNTFIVGWDIAITDNGPLIVEANEKPGMNAFQAINGGQRSRIIKCYQSLE